MESNTNQLESICRKVLEVDPSFRFVGIINDKGKLIAGGPRKDVKPIMDAREAEMVHTEVALMVRMRREHDPHLGLVNFAIARREKVVLMSFPIGEDILYISSTNKIDIGKVPFNILHILRSSVG